MSSPDDAGAPALPSYYRNTRPDVLRHLPAHPRRVLDVGCAAGDFGRAVRTAHPEAVVHGVEPHDEAASLAEQVLDAVHRGPFDAAALAALPGDEPYDCVVFNDVLEHMIAPDAALKLAHSALAPNGSVVASIPNIRNWQTLDEVLRGGRFRYRDKGVLDRTHLRFFCRDDMVALFEDNGFAVESLTGTGGLNVKNWQRWKLMSRLLGNGLSRDGQFLQFVVVARPAFTGG